MTKLVWLPADSQMRNLQRFFYKQMSYLHGRILQNLYLKKSRKDDSELTDIVLETSLWWNRQLEIIKPELANIFNGVNKYNDEQFRKIVKNATGVKLAPSKKLPLEFLDLLTNIPDAEAVLGEDADITRQEEYLDEIEENWNAFVFAYFKQAGESVIAWSELVARTAISAATASATLPQGVSPMVALRAAQDPFPASVAPALDRTARQTIERLKTEIESKIAGTVGSANKRAQLALRDAIETLDANLSQSRQTSVGVKQYRWRDRRDNRVRGNPTGKYAKAIPSHWHRNGEIFRWNSPPEGGHPGQAYLCRCRADPIFNKK